MTCRASGDHETEAVAAREYEQFLLRLMRARLPSGTHEGPVVFVGPSGMLQDVVRGAMRNVVSALSELAAAPGPLDPENRAALRDTAAAGAAWVETFLDCEAVVRLREPPPTPPTLLKAPARTRHGLDLTSPPRATKTPPSRSEPRRPPPPSFEPVPPTHLG